jgi:integrase
VVRVGEALQVEWSQVDLDARLIVLEEDQTKNAEARTVPLPSVLVMLLAENRTKDRESFIGYECSNRVAESLRDLLAGHADAGRPADEGAYKWYKYEGLIVHDLRRSAVRNLVNSGVPERVAMKISGHKTRAVFDRYHIVSTDDVTNAMRPLELNEAVGESLVKVPKSQTGRLPTSR